MKKKEKKQNFDFSKKKEKKQNQSIFQKHVPIIYGYIFPKK